MLNTDQHNPQVKKRMELAEFIRNNRGIDEGRSLPDQMLQHIYDDIKSNEIKLKDGNKNPSTKEDNPGTAKKVKKSGKAMDSNSQLQSLSHTIKQYNGATRDLSNLDSQFKPLEQSEFIEASNAGHIKHMIQTVWLSCLNALTTSLESTDNNDLISISLLGFRHTAYLCSSNSLEVELKAFIANLGKFVEVGDLLDLKEKNVLACKTLLEIAVENGESFKEHWDQVVKCMSKLDQIISAGIKIQEQYKTQLILDLFQCSVE
jgi:brefeldin A-inhibited guanine nucleotide-exchange protein